MKKKKEITKNRPPYCQNCIGKLPPRGEGEPVPKAWDLDVCPNCHAFARYTKKGHLKKLEGRELNVVAETRRADFMDMVEKLKVLNEKSVY